MRKDISDTLLKKKERKILAYSRFVFFQISNEICTEEPFVDSF